MEVTLKFGLQYGIQGGVIREREPTATKHVVWQLLRIHCSLSTSSVSLLSKQCGISQLGLVVEFLDLK